MGRLTKTYENGSFGVADKLPCGENSYAFKDRLIKKLGRYEELEEQERLIELPCTVGDTVYYPEEISNFVYPVKITKIIMSVLGNGKRGAKMDGKKVE